MAYSFARRTELARERGFRSYREQREVIRYARESLVEGGYQGRQRWPTDWSLPRANDRESLERAKLFHRAFKEEPNNYSRNGAKARWFVEVEGIMTYDEWQQRYPRGRREFGVDMAA